MSSIALATVLQNPAVWRGGDCAPEPATIASGFAALDAVLPGGGWPAAALTEIVLAQEGIGELGLAMPALLQVQAARRDVVWIAPPHVPYAPALQAAGLDLARFIVVHCPRAVDQLWAFEQALRAPECGAAFAWLGTRDERLLRRLQVAAREARTWGVLWRRPGETAMASAAPLRLHLAPRDGRLAVHVLKRRGGEILQPIELDVHAALPPPPARIAATLAHPGLASGGRPVDPRRSAGRPAGRRRIDVTQ